MPFQQGRGIRLMLADQVAGGAAQRANRSRNDCSDLGNPTLELMRQVWVATIPWTAWQPLEPR